MSTELIESSATLYHLALTLIHFLWQGGLIALTLKLTLIFSSYKHVQFRYIASCIAMLACLVAPIATFSYIYQPEISSSAIFLSNNLIVEQANTALHASPSPWYDEFVVSLPYVSIAWLTVVLLLTSKLTTEIYQVRRLSQVGTVLPSQKLQQRFEQLVKKVGASNKTRLLITLETSVPMALGWLKPIVLIPASMVTGLTPQQLDMLLLHELAHVRRHDYLVNFIQTLVETLLFFHPAVRWISKQMRNEREYCSDDIAVEHAGCAVSYAHTLADTASLCRQHRQSAIPSMAMAASGGDLKQRVVRLVDQHHCSSADDPGKFVASALIIVSMLALAVKPYINLPLIDISSGYIFFAETANENNSSRPINHVPVSDSSIASLLLNQERSEPVEQPTEKIAITTPISNQESAQSSTVLATKTESRKIQETIASTKSSNTQTSAQDLGGNKSASIQEKETKRELASATTTKSTRHNSPHIILDNPLIERSSSEVAFEKTDSTNASSGMVNPYAKDIAALIEEPEAKIIDEYNAQWNKPTATTPTASKAATLGEKNHFTRLNAKVLVSPDPRYPSAAKRRGLELDIKVNFTIDAQGKVKNLEFEKKSRVNYFRGAIRDAMSKWRFLPAKVNGKPVESSMSKIFSFSLMQ